MSKMLSVHDPFRREVETFSFTVNVCSCGCGHFILLVVSHKYLGLYLICCQLEIDQLNNILQIRFILNMYTILAQGDLILHGMCFYILKNPKLQLKVYECIGNVYIIFFSLIENYENMNMMLSITLRLHQIIL